MKEILKTTQLESDKSSFLIDLVKHESGKLYVEIRQMYDAENLTSQKLKINPKVLTKIIEVLQAYNKQMNGKTAPKTNTLTDIDKDSIQSYFLKGVTIKALAFQFNKPEAKIENVLRERGIEIVSQEVPDYLRKGRRRRRS